MKRRRNMKEESNEGKPKHQLDKRWKRPTAAAVIALLWMLPAAYSESEQKEHDEGSPASQTRHVSYLIGYRRLSSEWGNARNQIVPGLVDFDIRPRSWPVSIAARLAFSDSDALPIGADPRSRRSEFAEIDLGLRHVWRRFEPLQPFVGAGLAIVDADTTISLWYQSWHSTTAGPFVEVGFYVPIRWGLHTGVLITYAKGTGQLNGNGIETGGTQVAFLIGKSWGGNHRPSANVH
jgi:hypothetical protein